MAAKLNIVSEYDQDGEYNANSMLKSFLFILFCKTNASLHQRATFILKLAEYSRHTTLFLDLTLVCRTLFCDTTDQTLLHYILNFGFSSSVQM